jgi:16S rRNA (guanine527-N7)-methyltransferase
MISPGMDTSRIAELLQPFLGAGHGRRLTANDLQNISTYIDLLLRWNTRINLTAIRHPEEIVTRHFGESLFAARHLFHARVMSGQLAKPAPNEVEGAVLAEQRLAAHLIDVGSGAGFPGIPIKMWATHIHLTLIESTQKKATFLREIVRTLTLMDVDIFSDRAEAYHHPPAEVVTLRAVERFDATLPTAARLVTPGGRLALLISEAQLAGAYALTPDFAWQDPLSIPLSLTRRLAIGIRKPEQASIRLGVKSEPK